jgi:nucleotide-binding universal stress UspA family protein
MAKKCGAEVHLMSLLATGAEHEALGEAILKQEMETAQTHLDEVKAQADAAGVTCETHLIHGQTVDREIVDLADRLKADVIVMGRRGRRGLARMMLGHATAQVIGQAHCNVLVVPRAAKVEGRHIVLATDGSRFAEAAAVTAASLGRFCKTLITVASVTSADDSLERKAEADQAVQRAVEHLRGEGVSAEGTVVEGQPADVIAGLAREKAADLIVTGSHGRSGLERILLGSTSERILNETPCAVLVVKTA